MPDDLYARWRARDAFPLLPTLEPCPDCGLLVLVRVWHFASTDTPPRWDTLSVPRTPLRGEVHVCVAGEKETCYSEGACRTI